MNGIYLVIYRHNKVMYLGTTESPDRIIKNGLTHYLDAAQLRSWPRSGTALTSLFGGTQTSTLINGVGSNNDYGGTFRLDGTDDYIDMSGSFNNYINPSVGCTMTVWIYPYTFFFGTLNITGGYRPSGSNLWHSALLHCSSNSGFGAYPFWLRIYGRVVLSNNLDYYVESSSISFFVPSHVTMTFDCSTGLLRVYLNGVLSNTKSAAATSIRYFGDEKATIGRQYGGDYLIYNGGICSAVYYNRALTAAEILNNYNVTKTRFGL